MTRHGRHLMLSPSLKRREGGVVLAVALLSFASTAASADEFPAGCVFYKAGAPKDQIDDVQFIPGEAFSFAVIHDKAGKPTRCLYSTETTPFTITCQGRAPEPFSFAGPALHTHDILVFRNAAWYKVCYKPV
jgi:hypothetical protein